MEGSVVISLCALLMVVLMFLNVPIYASVLASTFIYFALNTDLQTMIFVQRIVGGVESIPLLAVPFFVCAGVYMNYTGITERVMNFCEVLTGHMAGGLAQVNVVLSAVMGGLSGSSLADAAMEAKMLVPEMEKKGLPKDFSSAVTGTSAILTPIIPPGIAMILYGCIANVSIGSLFISGLGLGIMACIVMMIVVAIISNKKKYPPSRETRATFKEGMQALKLASLPLFLPIVIIGGIRFGIFTATEAGAVAIIYALGLGTIAYRKMTKHNIIEGIKETVVITASVMLIIASASSFAWALTWERIPQIFTEMVLSSITSKYVFILVVNIFLLFVGMFIEGNAAMIVLIPLLVPVARAYGIDDIQFAMMFIFNLAIGSVTPPVGTLMYVTCGITGCKIKDYIKASIPFYIMLVGILFAVAYIPAITTFLPRIFNP